MTGRDAAALRVSRGAASESVKSTANTRSLRRLLVVQWRSSGMCLDGTNMDAGAVRLHCCDGREAVGPPGCLVRPFAGRSPPHVSGGFAMRSIVVIGSLLLGTMVAAGQPVAGPEYATGAYQCSHGKAAYAAWMASIPARTVDFETLADVPNCPSSWRALTSSCQIGPPQLEMRSNSARFAARIPDSAVDHDVMFWLSR